MELLLNRVFKLIKEGSHTQENLVILTNSSGFFDVVRGLSVFPIEECSGKYFSFAGKKLWVKKISDTPPDFKFDLELCFITEGLDVVDKMRLGSWQDAAA